MAVAARCRSSRKSGNWHWSGHANFWSHRNVGFSRHDYLGEIPVFVVFFAAIRLKQPVSLLQLVGIVAAFAGIVVVASGRSQSGPAGYGLAGPLWMIASSVAIAFYYVWSVELTRRYGTAIVAAGVRSSGFSPCCHGPLGRHITRLLKSLRRQLNARPTLA